MIGLDIYVYIRVNLKLYVVCVVVAKCSCGKYFSWLSHVDLRERLIGLRFRRNEPCSFTLSAFAGLAMTVSKNPARRPFPVAVCFSPTPAFSDA